MQADVLARHHRRLGHEVRLQTGTDENSLKNVLAAESAGVPLRDWVDRRNEVLALIDGGLRDFSISRSRERARGWGIPVPDDPSQVIYVWWDALGNYVTSLDTPDSYQRWWATSDRRIHLLGKGVVRFHAVYWPALLLSAGLPLPTDIVVHDYLTIDGQKIGKSTGGGADPAELAARYGGDPVRWWLLREVPRIGDVDFTEARLVARANADLAGGIGNLVKRVVTLVHRYRDGRVPDHPAPEPLAPDAPKLVAAALAGFELRRACDAVWSIVDEANRYLDWTRPWELARTGRADPALAILLAACRHLADELSPFLPGAATAVAAQVTAGPDRRLPTPRQLFPRL